MTRIIFTDHIGIKTEVEVEERAVPKPVLAIEVEANCPYLPGLQRAFCSDLSAGVPSGKRR